jgi:TATA-box binding protein (TBP) (component of TFIID and TFIIIB)
MAASDIAFIAPTLNFTPLRISTITTTAQIGTKIHLDALYDQIPILPYWDHNDGVLKMSFNGHAKGTCFKDLMLKPKETATSFFNQATLIIRRETSPHVWKEINVKLFRNGGVQMTGVRSIGMASEALHWLIAHIQTVCRGAAPIFAAAPTIHKEDVQLINTDFSIGSKVKRDVLHRVLAEKYGLNSSYESAIYQGVKTKYFYNAARPAHAPPGLCPCEKMCKGTGDGSALGACKKITISPFQTGQVIITGARDIKQINEAYEFIKDVFRTHADAILRKVYVLPPTAAVETAVAAPKKATAFVWIAHPCPRNVMKIGTATLIRASVQGIVYLIESASGRVFTYDTARPTYIGDLMKLEDTSPLISKSNGCLAKTYVKYREDIRDVMTTLRSAAT